MKKTFAFALLCASLVFVSGCTSQPSSGSTQAYWIKESNIKHNPSGDTTWTVHVVKAKPRAADRKSTDVEPNAFMASVRGELKNSRETKIMIAPVPEDGIARWNLPVPTEETKLFITDIKGELEWSADDKAFWATRPALTYTPGETKE